MRSEVPYSRGKGQVPGPCSSTSQGKKRFPSRRFSEPVEWRGSLSPVCFISPCCAVFLVDIRDTLWPKIAKKDLTDYPWFTPDSKEHAGRLWVLRGATEMPLGSEVLSWCQCVLDSTIILMEHVEAYSSFLLVFKGNITGKKGPEKSQKKQIFSVGKKASDVDCAE